jgi:Uma2 family endonuclease
MIKLIEEKKYTVTECFELERHSEKRLEFHHGKVIELERGSKKSNEIALNIVEIIRKSFSKKGYEVYAHNVKVETNNGNVYRYPDVVVTLESDDSDDYIVLSPEIIVEVAKDSMHTDSVTKLKEYKKIPSMQYYIIIAQDEMEVQFYSRSGNKWMVEIFDLPNDMVELPLFNRTFSLADIYDAVKI